MSIGSFPPVRAAITRWKRGPIWWLEIVLVVVFYWVYALVRDAHGESSDQAVAFAHGHDVESLEQWLHLDFEVPVQNFFLHSDWLLKIMGGVYGSLHFIITFAVLAWLLFRRPEVYRRWRRVLGLITMTAVALFALYPTAPPRLTGRTVDTIATVGGLWSYNNGVIERITDPYAAMPSLHLGWSCWVAASLAATVGANWSARKRWLFALYPIMITVIVIATGTHWSLDTVAGAALMGAVWFAERGVRRRWARRHTPPATMRPPPVHADHESLDDALVD